MSVDERTEPPGRPDYREKNGNGFDPLTVRQRLAQVRREAHDWKHWGEERSLAVWNLWGDHRDEIRTEIERLRRDGVDVHAEFSSGPRSTPGRLEPMRRMSSRIA